MSKDRQAFQTYVGAIQDEPRDHSDFELGLALMATALFGVSGEGATRWAKLGPILIQPSLILLPMLVVLLARTREPLAMAGARAKAGKRPDAIAREPPKPVTCTAARTVRDIS